MQLLLEDQETNTAGSQDTLYINNVHLMGKYLTVVAYGTWDGATITTEFSPDSGTTWIACGSDTTFTANGGGNIYLSPSGLLVRGSLTSAGASTSLTLSIQ